MEFKRPVQAAAPQKTDNKVSGFESEVLAERWAQRVTISAKQTDADDTGLQLAIERASKGSNVPKEKPKDASD